ncbi:hypothetical protein OIDMADRAFT_126407 [Oidiodendron maius Zn]|uniref:Heterokaryon incompatibility domain-containing protein n=1 Tax=Oidiodendron maius (strain Zn) TaxID=913774 RepID=A0A0C3CLI7_OIDMZ|nr:hypothetical protein OIDMADRAFT_126407 [Oidiodendron maius Zn]
MLCCEAHSHFKEARSLCGLQDYELIGLKIKIQNVLQSLRVIECSTRRLVKAPEDCIYLALSYVWGSPTDSEPEVRGNDFLPCQLPLTIEDAITVTLQLGHEYLWVDRYCIPQTKSEEFEMQIRHMNLVYKNAYATIVAAAGEDPNYGLPGVSKRARNIRPSTRIGQHYIASIPDSVEPEILQSKWNSRAWTYQEAIFSKRRIIFTDFEVYFDCERMRCRESIRTDLDTPSQGYYCDQTTPEFLPFELGHDSSDYYERVQKYTQRSLTYDSDILNAFQGLLREYETRRGFKIYHVWGVPTISCIKKTFGGGDHQSVVKTSLQGFMLGLCWFLKSPSERRVGFPSWSWVGWKGIIESQGHQFYGRLEDLNDPQYL